MLKDLSRQGVQIADESSDGTQILQGFTRGRTRKAVEVDALDRRLDRVSTTAEQGITTNVA